MKFTMTLNGAPAEFEGSALDRLIDHLPDAGLTGPRKSCGIGRCGACMVLLDGMPVNACLLPLGRVMGRAVTTAEGLDRRADAVIARLAEHGAVQCGYCTPGMLVGLVAALEDPAHPDAEEVEQRLTGNLCRCSGYAGLRQAIAELFAPDRPAPEPAADCS